MMSIRKVLADAGNGASESQWLHMSVFGKNNRLDLAVFLKQSAQICWHLNRRLPASIGAVNALLWSATHSLGLMMESV